MQSKYTVISCKCQCCNTISLDDDYLLYDGKQRFNAAVGQDRADFNYSYNSASYLKKKNNMFCVHKICRTVTKSVKSI